MPLSKTGRYEMRWEGIGERGNVLEDELDGVGREGVHGGGKEEKGGLTPSL